MPPMVVLGFCFVIEVGVHPVERPEKVGAQCCIAVKDYARRRVSHRDGFESVVRVPKVRRVARETGEIPPQKVRLGDLFMVLQSDCATAHSAASRSDQRLRQRQILLISWIFVPVTYKPHIVPDLPQPSRYLLASASIISSLMRPLRPAPVQSSLDRQCRRHKAGAPECPPAPATQSPRAHSDGYAPLPVFPTHVQLPVAGRGRWPFRQRFLDYA